MKHHAFSLRTRLTAVYSGLFLLAGAVLLAVTYLLVRSRLPNPATFTAQPGTPAGPTPIVGTVSGLVGQYRESALSTLLLQSAIALVIMAVLAAVLGWFTAGRVLRPLHAVTATARRFSAENPDRRINLGGPPDELKELADTFDDMLERLMVSFDGQKRFVANASHELRTPLAVQRTLIEVALSDPDAPLRLRKLGEQLLDANRDSELLIEGLLVLAQSDRGLAQRTPVRLDELAAAVAGGFAEQADARGVRLDSALRPCTVAGDAVLLERLITNLVQNAVTYNVPGGTVRVDVGPDTALVVGNTGPDIPGDLIESLFAPFRRLTPDRTANTHNAGLGLSIVRSIARAHGGDVDAVPGPDGGLIVTTRLPTSQPNDRR